MKKEIINLHIIFNNKKIAERRVQHSPRVGDEIRLNDDIYYTVTRCCWCYDEEENIHSRLNIEVIESVDI